LDRSTFESPIHPSDDFVVRMIQNARMIGVLDCEEFDKRKLSRQLTAHSHRNHVVIRAVENRFFARLSD
jgi:hypothetical protein